MSHNHRANKETDGGRLESSSSCCRPSQKQDPGLTGHHHHSLLLFLFVFLLRHRDGNPPPPPHPPTVLLLLSLSSSSPLECVWDVHNTSILTRLARPVLVAVLELTLNDLKEKKQIKLTKKRDNKKNVI